MDKQVINLAKYIDHALLKPEFTLDFLKRGLDEAIENAYFGICIHPKYVKWAKDYIGNNPVKVVTVIGFPLGQNLTATKEFEAQKALEDGADELDMVIDIGSIKSKEYKRAYQDIKAVVNKSDKSVKVILETDLLEKEEIIEACKISADAGAKFVKTSTGFVPNAVNATVEIVKLMYETVSPYGVEVKASGGIRDRSTAIEMINAGATRIGTSSSLNIVKGDISDTLQNHSGNY